MAQGGFRKVVLLPMKIKINGVQYEEQLTIGGYLFQKNHCFQISYNQSEVKVVNVG